MTCAQAQALVQSRGSVVLSTGPRRFDRYVAGPIGFCEQSEYAYRRSVPTAGNPVCPIGYVCTNEIPPWLMDRF
jgi:hypothetical protein